MKSSKTINLPKKTKINKKKNYSNNKEIKTKKTIISFSRNRNSIV